ncbi:DUF4032 domain-containing protein [Egibacter rhizosphaerae]|uniref:DUF4032 domain-containing protein n=1 Tax=Egibacter rhizosphaerae TaxID=1670831 RepID=A0A411YIM1_9ACTN|nr:DUF4032 domain-containing protein [Egibacter rhizosphaerae]QBI21155.1 DUF4032 domain-containing protein [Egibacter rhizosphaerae]
MSASPSPAGTTTSTPARTRGLRLRTRAGHPDFLDLPWDQPLEAWTGDRLVDVARGVHRHVVRFVEYDGALYALKELPRRLAEREYRLLRRMAEEDLPVVEVVGVVNRERIDPEEPLEDVLITRYLDYSLPYRLLFTHRRTPPQEGSELHGLHERLIDALAMLLVRMHILGFYWGDCSLSNTLFRRDAGALAAYIVDLETGELHSELTDGQRAADLEITQTNVAGGLMDVQAELDLPADPDPVETAERLQQRYDLVWAELNQETVIGPDERYKIEQRVRRLNDLGFAVDEVELLGTDGPSHTDESRLRLRVSVTEQGHHRRRLLSLTGLDAQENQARSLLNDLANFRAAKESQEGRALPESVAAYRWLNEIYEPTVRSIPAEHTDKLEPVEVFHEIIEHKWFLSRDLGRDVGVAEATESYFQRILPEVPPERAVLATEDEAELGWIGFG